MPRVGRPEMGAPVSFQFFCFEVKWDPFLVSFACFSSTNKPIFSLLFLNFASHISYRFEAKWDKCYFAFFLFILVPRFRFISLLIFRSFFKDIQHNTDIHKQAAWTYSMDMWHGRSGWACSMDKQHGHPEHKHAARACSRGMQQGHTAWT